MPIDAPALISSNTLAEYLELTPQALANMRSQGTGPTYIRVGRGIRYRWEDVKAWLEANTHTSSDEYTNQPGTYNRKATA